MRACGHVWGLCASTSAMFQLLLYAALVFMNLNISSRYDVLTASCADWTAEFTSSMHLYAFRPIALTLYIGLCLLSIVSLCESVLKSQLLFAAAITATLLCAALPAWFLIPYTVTPDMSSLQQVLGSKAMLLPDIVCNSSAYAVALLEASNLPAACATACDRIADVDFCCVPFALSSPSQSTPQLLILDTPWGSTVIYATLALLCWSGLKCAWLAGRLFPPLAVAVPTTELNTPLLSNLNN